MQAEGGHLGALIRAKILAGTLPKDEPVKVWAGYGKLHAEVFSGERCVGSVRWCKVNLRTLPKTLDEPKLLLPRTRWRLNPRDVQSTSWVCRIYTASLPGDSERPLLYSRHCVKGLCGTQVATRFVKVHVLWNRSGDALGDLQSSRARAQDVVGPSPRFTQ